MAEAEQQEPGAAARRDEAAPGRDGDPEQAALDALKAAVRRGAPQDWVRADLAARMLAEVYESEVFYTRADGSTVPGPVDDPGLREVLREHRVATFGGLTGGPWFSLRFYVPRDADWWIVTDNRWEPDWRAPVADAAFRADYEAFPWDFGHMPGWLPDKVLAEGEARP